MMQENYFANDERQKAESLRVATLSREVDQDEMNDREMLDAIQKKLGAFAETTARVDAVESEDAKPTATTMTMSYAKKYEANAKQRVSTNAKMAVAGYVAVVLLLVLAVAFCSVAATNAFSSMVTTEETYSQTSKALTALEEQVASEDYSALLARASEMGFVEASGSYTYTELETRPAQNFNIQTNWFDQLCDWLSSVFGG